MGNINRHGKLQKKVRRAKLKSFEPQVFVDHDADFASIKIAPGIEAKSYVKEGLVFCEDENGNIIEIQVLNLSSLAKKKTSAA